MDKVEEILPRILDYLKFDLANEKLSSRAEKRRQYYVERIEHAQPEVAVGIISSKYEKAPCTEDLNRRRPSGVLHGAIVPKPFNKTSSPPAEAKLNSRAASFDYSTDAGAYEMIPYDLQPTENIEYEDAGQLQPPRNTPSPLPVVNDVAPCYEETVLHVTASQPTGLDSDKSGTDYESYDDEDDDDDDVKNKIKRNISDSQLQQQRQSKPQSNKSTRSDGRRQTKQRSEKIDHYADMTGRKFSGDLYQRKKFQFEKRFCAICGTSFFCCKSEKDPKVICSFSLSEYDVVEGQKDGKYSHELRLSCPGKQTFLFYTDSTEAAQIWVQELSRASAAAAAVKGDHHSETTTCYKKKEECYIPSDDSFDKQSETSETNISGGSVDKTKNLPLADSGASDGKKKSKLQAILGTISKKIGNKTKIFLQTTNDGNLLPAQNNNDDQNISGLISLCNDELTGGKWQKKFCKLKNGHLQFFRQHSFDSLPEFSLSLPGAQLSPLEDNEDKDQLNIKLIQDGQIYCLQLSDFMEHGRWLTMFIKETGYADQLLRMSRANKMLSSSSSSSSSSLANNVASVYEELRQFMTLEGVTEDETVEEEQPPPLPTYSPPNSPVILTPATYLDLKPEIQSKPKKSPKTGGGEGGGGGESIYLEPSQFIDTNLRRKTDDNRIAVGQDLKNHSLKEQEKEEATYMNQSSIKNIVAERQMRSKGSSAKIPLLASGHLYNSSPNLASNDNTSLDEQNEVHPIKLRPASAFYQLDISSSREKQLKTKNKNSLETKDVMETQKQNSNGSKSERLGLQINLEKPEKQYNSALIKQYLQKTDVMTSSGLKGCETSGGGGADGVAWKSRTIHPKNSSISEENETNNCRIETDPEIKAINKKIVQDRVKLFEGRQNT